MIAIEPVWADPRVAAATTILLETRAARLQAGERHVADLLAAFEMRLSAGSVIITGSVTRMQFAVAGDHVAVELGSLGAVEATFA